MAENNLVQKEVPKVVIPINAFIFESLLNYVILSKHVNIRFVRNIIKLLDMIDKSVYVKDTYITTVIQIIEMAAKMRYDGISNITYIRNIIENSSLEKKHVDTILKNIEPLDKSESENLNNIIRSYVEYAYIYQSRQDIMVCYDDLMNTQGKATEIAVKALQQKLEILLSNIRRADATRSEMEGVSISANPSKDLKIELGKLYDNLTDPCNILKTGLKELNRFLNGGFRRKGMVIIYGPTNSFKSGILLYSALWMIQFNPGLKAKEKEKKLAVAIVTMENTRDEELERIHAIYTQGMVDVQAIDKETWLSQWNEIFPNLSHDIELHIIYKSPIDTTTLDIQAAIEELEEDHKLEVMAVIVDHLGNIKSRNKNGGTNEWRETVQIAYELSSWAKTSNRALITAMHTNSAIDEKIAEAIAQGKTNIVRMLGRHCIADAKYIDRAVDLSLYIYREYSHLDGKWYLGFKTEKQRGRMHKGANMFYHRLDNEITLVYDENTSVIRSYPCIPGTENTIQMQQNQQTLTPQQPVMPPMQAMVLSPFQGQAGHQFTGHQFVPPILNQQISIPFDNPTTKEFIDDHTDNLTEEDFKDDTDELATMMESNQSYDENSEDIITDEDFSDDIETELIQNNQMLTGLIPSPVPTIPQG